MSPVTLQPDTIEHTFSNGSTALIHPSIPWMVMLRTAAFEDELVLIQDINRLIKGEPIKDPQAVVAVQDAIVCGMFVAPRVHRRDADDVPEGEFTVDLLADSVYGEVLELALREVRAAATFRPDADGDGDGGDGADLGDDAERADAAAEREPVGVGDGRDPG